MMKKVIVAGILGALLMGAPELVHMPCAYAAEAIEASQNGIDWSQGYYTAVGVARTPAGMDADAGMPLARRGAIMDAQRNLAGIIKGTQIDADSLMENLIVKSDVVKTGVKAMLTGAVIVEEKQTKGGYQVTMRVPMYGQQNSLAAAVLPEIRKDTMTTPAPVIKPTSNVIIKKVQNAPEPYTGIIVDASGLGLQPTFSPILYDENGRAIYGIKNINYDKAISQGMVGYAGSMDEAKRSKRVGSNPLIVRAKQVRGGANSANPVNPVVDVDTAETILAANQVTDILLAGAVIFIR